MKWCLLLSLLTLAALISDASGSRILFITAVSAKSQWGFFIGVANALAKNGHDVTIVAPYKSSNAHPKLREIVLKDLEVTKHLPNVFTSRTLQGPQALVSAGPKLCSDALGREEVQALFKEKFDLGMMSVVFNNCFHALFHHLKVPVIHVCPLHLASPAAVVTGNPGFPSFVSSPFVHVSHPFSFFERTLNTVVDTLGGTIFMKMIIPNIEAECRSRGLCKESLPNILELSKNASLILVNSVKTVESPPRPYVPSVVHVGGIHCHEPKPLSLDLENWIKGAGDDGFIFFSLGSVVIPSTMPEEYRLALIKAFGSLKQRVLWRWDADSMDDLPPNVRVEKWLPQQDILGHPRLRLFITHGGALSTQESMYHGTAVLGLPVFADQMANMMEAQNQGWAKVLKWEELTPELLRASIIEVMNDDKLRAEVKRRATLMHDLPMTPAETTNYWVEYVIRYNGAPHLRSPLLDMPWYQAYNVDVWLTVLTVILIVLYIALKLLLITCRFCCSSKAKSKKD